VGIDLGKIQQGLVHDHGRKRLRASLMSAKAVTEPGSIPKTSIKSSGLPKLNRPNPRRFASPLRSALVSSLATTSPRRPSLS
jgi:hypothetical protein